MHEVRDKYNKITKLEGFVLFVCNIEEGSFQLDYIYLLFPIDAKLSWPFCVDLAFVVTPVPLGLWTFENRCSLPPSFICRYILLKT